MNEKETRTPGYRVDETPDNSADTEFAETRAKFAGQMDFGKASGLVKAALTG